MMMVIQLKNKLKTHLSGDSSMVLIDRNLLDLETQQVTIFNTTYKTRSMHEENSTLI